MGSHALGSEVRWHLGFIYSVTQDRQGRELCLTDKLWVGSVFHAGVAFSRALRCSRVTAQQLQLGRTRCSSSVRKLVTWVAFCPGEDADIRVWKLARDSDLTDVLTEGSWAESCVSTNQNESPQAQPALRHQEFHSHSFLIESQLVQPRCYFW